MKLIDRLKGVVGATLLLISLFVIIGGVLDLATWLIRIPIIQLLTINGFLAPYMTLGLMVLIGWGVSKVFKKRP